MADTENGTDDISSKEFQRQLFDWFEKRGLLSELRAFMRHRMISALYSCENPCPKLRFASSKSVSPTFQALLLLVVEFLVQQEYHYTMSVLVAEAPLIASFPKFSAYVSYMSPATNLSKGCNLPRYVEKDVQEILEVFGITSDSKTMDHILRLYSNNKERESLLACVLTALSAIVQNCLTESTNSSNHYCLDDSSNAIYWIEEIRLMLLRVKLTAKQLQQLEELLRKLQADTASKVRREEREKHNKIMHIREQQLMAEALVQEEKIRAQTLEVEEDLRSKQKHLEHVTLQLRKQHDQVLNRLNKVQEHADKVKQQEYDLIEREKALVQKQAIVEEERHSLTELRTELQEAAHALRQENCDSKAILELKYLQERCLQLELELKETKTQISSSFVNRSEMGVQASTNFECESCGNVQVTCANQKISNQNHHQSTGGSISFSAEKSKEKEANNQVSLLKRVLRRVQQENSELRAITAQQRRRIDELTRKAAELANNSAHVFETSPPPQAQPSSLNLQTQSREQPHVPHSQFECVSAPRHKAHATPQTLRSQGRDWRRKHPKQLIEHVNWTTSLSSDESPTEEVLREARNRLRRLEEESEAVDRSYRDFRARQASNFASTTVTASTAVRQSTKNVVLLSTHQNIPNSSRVQPTSLTSPHGARLNGPSLLSSSLRSHLPSRFLSGFSTFPRSQLKLPERSLYQIPRTACPTQVPDSYSSIRQFDAAIRKPAERLQTLNGSQPSILQEGPATEKLTKSFVQHNEASRSSWQMDLAKEEKCISDTPQVPQVTQNENLRESSQRAPSFSSADLQRNDALPEGHGHVSVGASASENKQNLEEKVSQSSDHESKSTSPKSERIDLKAKSALPKLDSRQPALDLSNLEGQYGEVLLPMQSAIVPYSPKKQPSKPNPTDTTLNEVSTLSSSPTLSNTNGASVKTKAIFDLDVLYEDGQKNGSSNLMSNMDIGTQKYLQQDVEHGKATTETMFKFKSEVGKSAYDRANPLLNTSLSSIENSEQRLSAGSQDPKTDEDDFW